MTPEEILEKFKAAGVEPGKWAEHEEHTTHAGGLDSVVKGLMQLRDMLEGEAENRRKKIVELKLKVAQMTRGGGR